MSEVDVDGDRFEVIVVKIGRVNRRIFNAVVNEDGETATASITRTISTKEGVVEKRRIRKVRSEFGLLNAGDFHVVFMKITLEFMFRGVDGVYVNL